MNERLLSKLASWATASAMSLVGLVLLFVVFVMLAVTGEFTGRSLGALVGFVGSGVPLWLLSSLADQERSRRLASWGFSAAFHVVAVGVGVLVLGLRAEAVVFMVPQLTATILCLVGLILSVGGACPDG
jgi:predicted MFS family arabinose efflux permease